MAEVKAVRTIEDVRHVSDQKSGELLSSIIISASGSWSGKSWKCFFAGNEGFISFVSRVFSDNLDKMPSMMLACVVLIIGLMGQFIVLLFPVIDTKKW